MAVTDQRCVSLFLDCGIGLGVSIVYIRLTVTIPAIVIEGHRPMTGWNRSWHLTSAAVWQTLQVVMLANLLVAIIAFVPGFAVFAGGQRLFEIGRAHV